MNKTNPNDSFNAVRNRWDSGQESWDLQETGATKREVFAAQIIIGVIENPSIVLTSNPALEGIITDFHIAKTAVNLADALIDALNQNQEIEGEQK